MSLKRVLIASLVFGTGLVNQAHAEINECVALFLNDGGKSFTYLNKLGNRTEFITLPKGAKFSFRSLKPSLFGAPNADIDNRNLALTSKLESNFPPAQGGLPYALDRLKQCWGSCVRILASLGTRKIEIDIYKGYDKALRLQDFAIVTQDNAVNARAELQDKLERLDITEQHIASLVQSGASVLIVGEGAGRIFPYLLSRGVKVKAADSWYGQDVTQLNLPELRQFQSQYAEHLIAANPRALTEISEGSFDLVVSISHRNEARELRYARVYAAFRASKSGGMVKVLTPNNLVQSRSGQINGTTYSYLPNRIVIQKGTMNDLEALQSRLGASNAMPTDVADTAAKIENILKKHK